MKRRFDDVSPAVSSMFFYFHSPRLPLGIRHMGDGVLWAKRLNESKKSTEKTSEDIFTH